MTVRGPLLLPSEAARLANCHVKTLARWAASGRIASIRTPGGHRRYRLDDVLDMMRRWQGKP